MWQEVNDAFRHLIHRHERAMQPARGHAGKIREQLESLFPLMDTLCARTCPDCTEPCCRVAKLWYNFQDLLFLHLQGIPPPERQPILSYHDHCRYLTTKGCRLPRISRPWICTWYLCPPQTRGIRKMGKPLRDEVEDRFQTIKQLRTEMEEAFIRVVR